MDAARLFQQPDRDRHRSHREWDVQDELRQHTDLEDRKRAAALLAGEKQLLEMVASGAALPAVLDAVCRLVEETDVDCCCSILLIDERSATVHHGAAPTLPAEFTGDHLTLQITYLYNIAP